MLPGYIWEYKLTHSDSTLIGAHVVAFVDDSIDALRVMRTPAFSGTAISVPSQEVTPPTRPETAAPVAKSNSKSSASSKPAKIPRPPNPFILYRQHNHPKVKAEHPDYHNNDICEYLLSIESARELTILAIILGSQWKNESEEVKAHYKALAEELKKKHAEDHPDYQYAPRKPSEKKRRATSRQYARFTKHHPAPESPASASATSNMSSPPMMQGFQPAEVPATAPVNNMNGLNIMLGPNDMMDEQFQFNTDAYDALVQQVPTQEQYIPYQGFTNDNTVVDQTGADTFELSDFVVGDIF